MTQECGITAGPIVWAGRLIAIEQEICQIRAGRGCYLLPRLELHMGGGGTAAWCQCLTAGWWKLPQEKADRRKSLV